ncbi:MAG TPA: hypothetical protein VLI39_07930, partial [Sedimentisphaerales bacterium]|nr:hypothetical protein [Sedimentisphaerales bacterium]
RIAGTVSKDRPAADPLCAEKPHYRSFGPCQAPATYGNAPFPPRSRAVCQLQPARITRQRKRLKDKWAGGDRPRATSDALRILSIRRIP